MANLIVNSSEWLGVEVAFALPDKQVILPIQVAVGTSLLDAAINSGINNHFPELDVASARLGVFGKLVAKPAEQAVKEGDRIEIYRPLLADPKASRLRRAEKKTV
ncbi:MAG: RnfH family protein [Pseudomonadaceae bacterium]|nr:RnfH family protein [Pseudomonadaceae bacterium]